MYMVMYIILLIAAKVNCRWTTATPSIHSSRVRSTSEVYIMYRSTTRTPYLDNWFDGVRDDWRSSTGSSSRPVSWWWRFIGQLKRNLEKKDQVSSTTMTAVRNVESLLPETIVTYSIKGCSPTIVPFDLSACSNLPPDAPHHVSTTRVIYYVPPLSRIDSYDQSDFDQ
ncbi:Uncharacterized protein FWK35_00020454 [Aphis craccivora]|uniref:Secreted protein n=1 Tax=Aphis craccivora TaxID=307492 RepID=A0A6G0Z774_APHCR|nr:Uncharacterized protein FWK35_00020454 [Aphis craccivora]